ncbi:hypothetical protein, partial [Flagellimonas flava]|uniref:hypothetical protein n=1 Tax=Flagellimonas flava TaxID=570519 RepID=UPI003D653311
KDAPYTYFHEIVTGPSIFGIDIKLPHKQYATVRKNPVHEGAVSSFDASETKPMQPVIAVHELNNKDYAGRLLSSNSP